MYIEFQHTVEKSIAQWKPELVAKGIFAPLNSAMVTKVQIQ